MDPFAQTVVLAIVKADHVRCRELTGPRREIWEHYHGFAARSWSDGLVAHTRVDEFLTVPAYRAPQEERRLVNISGWQPADTFVIKVYRRGGGALSGLIEHLRTGEKQGFSDLASVTNLMALMISRNDAPTREAGS